jgi:hypothetical protein
MAKKIIINGIINIPKTTTTTQPPKKIVINMFEVNIKSGILQEEYDYYILQDGFDYAKILLDN